MDDLVVWRLGCCSLEVMARDSCNYILVVPSVAAEEPITISKLKLWAFGDEQPNNCLKALLK